jgi:hypothetical protein
MRVPTLILPLAVAGTATAQVPLRPRAELLGPRPPVPSHYVCRRAPETPIVDGRLDDAAWDAAPWTSRFTDIEGEVRPAPRYLTRARLLWDDAFLYVGAELEEPDLWATLTARDAVIFHDHDFEIFLDPDGDTHAYFELEINTLGTVWDLFLSKPYRDGAQAENGWDISGLRSAVALRGTLNDPSDRDTAWSVELAIPWTALAPPGQAGRAPREGDQWRINFSRVEWDLVVTDGRYVKRTDPATGRPTPEHNWVWSPQHAINMHLPELWGVVQFSEEPVGREVTFREPPDEEVRWALRRIYYAQSAFFLAHSRYAAAVTELGVPGAAGVMLTLLPQAGGYEATARDARGTVWHIREDGRIWRQ